MSASQRRAAPDDVAPRERRMVDDAVVASYVGASAATIANWRATRAFPRPSDGGLTDLNSVDEWLRWRLRRSVADHRIRGSDT